MDQIENFVNKVRLYKHNYVFSLMMAAFAK